MAGRKRKRRQKGGALFRRKKPRLVDKIAGVGKHYRRRRQTGRGLLGILGSAAKIGYKLGKDKRYKRMGAIGVTGSYNRRPAPREV